MKWQTQDISFVIKFTEVQYSRIFMFMFVHPLAYLQIILIEDFCREFLKLCIIKTSFNIIIIIIIILFL